MLGSGSSERRNIILSFFIVLEEGELPFALLNDIVLCSTTGRLSRVTFIDQITNFMPENLLAVSPYKHQKSGLRCEEELWN